jgi:NTE family protein
MGSIVALGYAAGLSAAEMREIALRIGNVRTTLSALDFTLTQPGLLAGNRLMAIFLPFLSKRDFSELVVPCRTVATDIESGECVQIQAGRLDLAFRASSSVPVLWSPVRHLDRVLVDGAIVNPVPVDVAREMGADFVIGVNVVPSLKRGVSTAVARAFRAASWLNPLSYLGGAGGLPSLFDVTMNSIQQLQHELGKFRGISADVQITPDLSDFTWIEFYRPAELIERGARAAEEALPRIRQALADRAQAV